MAKELERFRKELAKLKKDAEECISDYRDFQKNWDNARGLLGETAKEVGRLVQKCKDDGAEGKKLEAFEGSTEIDKTLRAGKGFLDDLKREEKKLAKIMTASNGCMASLRALKKEVEADIKTRSAKSSRPVLPRESKSLPEIQKLPDEIDEIAERLAQDVIQDNNASGWSVDFEEKRYERQLKDEVAQTKDARKARDEAETDSQAVDIRLVKGAEGKFARHETTVQTEIASAEKLNGQRRFVEAATAVKNASDALEEMEDILAPYLRWRDRLNAHALRGVQESKDGRYTLNVIDTMGTTISDYRKKLKKLDRVTA